MRIQNNITAVNSHRNYGINNRNLSRGMEKLSSGFRINRAADDAAGLAISEKMRAQIRGLTQASRNVQDGISLVQTAEGGMQTIQDIVQRVRELVVQAANDTNDQLDRTAIQAEIDQLIAEIDDIADTTEFNGRKLLTGAYARLSEDFSVTGASVMSVEQFVASSDTANTPVSMNGSVAATTGILPLNSPSSDFTIDLNDIVAGSGVAGQWSFDGSVLTLSGNSTFEINGGGIQTYRSIRVDNGINAGIILNNVNIVTTGSPALDLGMAVDAANPATTVNLWLEGDNTLRSNTIGFAGARVASGNTLTIDGDGTLYARGHGSTSGAGAGIGGDNNGYGSGGPRDAGKIYINGGTVTARGGRDAAGIGGAFHGGFGVSGGLTISDATVYAFGGTDGAGIGVGCGGTNASGGVITINPGAMVQVTNGGPVNHHSGQFAVGGGTGTELFLNGGLLEVMRGRVGSSNPTNSTITSNGGHLSINTVSLATTPTPPIYGGTANLDNPNDPQSHLALNPHSILSNVVDNSGNPLHRVRVFLLETPDNPPYDWSFGAHETLSFNLNSTPMAAVTDSLGRLFLYLPYGSNASIIKTVNGQQFEGEIADIGDNHHLNRIVLTPASTSPPDAQTWPHADSPGGTVQVDGGYGGHDEYGGLIIQSGANSGQILRVFIEAMHTHGLGLRDFEGAPHLIDVSRGTNPPPTAEEISDLLIILDEALNRVSMARADLGAMQNRMEFKMLNLDNQAENVAAAESRIRDADMAMEMTDFTRNNILMQSSTAMLAQANALPQSVLQLLG